MKITINKKLLRRFEYATYCIYIYPKKVTEKAVEFYLFDQNRKMTKETLWIPKSSLESGKEGIDYYGLDWIFNDYNNREKLEKIGYRL